MLPKSYRYKFNPLGRKARAARLTGVSRTTVTLWLRGLRACPKLDRLARTPIKEWVTYDPHG
jgi:hypothetical protein